MFAQFKLVSGGDVATVVTYCDKRRGSAGGRIRRMPALPSAGLGPVRVLLVEDHELVRQAFSLAFEEMPDIDLVGLAGLLEEGIAAARQHEPDVVLLDRRLPDGDAIDSIRRFREASPASQVLVLTGYADDEVVARVVEAGAAGLSLKGGHVNDLAEIIRRVAGGERSFPPDLSRGVPGGPAPSR
jgi:DNA-binding NarL/FixJ family response regulator